MSTRTVFFVYLLLALCPIFNNIIQGKPTRRKNNKAGLIYLQKYGYLTNAQGGLAQGAQELTQSLKALQRFAGLKETGKLDNETIKLIETPRCGDKDPTDKKRRRRRYALHGTKWDKKELTFKILNNPYDGPTSRKKMPPELILKTIKAAFQKWSFASQLTFTEQKEGNADIKITFIKGNHNDGWDFDGRGHSLAHAFYPQKYDDRAGDVHFDMDEKFSLTEYDATNFIWVTTHEFGHSLGLKHSSIKGAIMYPWYTAGKMGDVELKSDDVNAIQYLYGKPTGKNREKKIVLPSPPRSECKITFNATFHDKHRKRVYATNGFDYYVLNQNGGKSKGPKSVGTHWEKLITEVRAAYTRNDGYTIFFSRFRYTVFYGTKHIKGPDFIENYGLPPALREMDAAVVFGGNGETYFFKGDMYWKFNEETKRIYAGYPKLITRYWRGLPANLDSALQTPSGETYFFKDGQYYKFDHYSFSVLPNYPKPIGPDWLGCTKEESQHVLFRLGGNSSLGLRASNIAVLIAVIWIMLFNYNTSEVV